MSKIDLRIYKKEIRAQMRRIRREMPPEIVQKKDQAIYERLISMEQYRRAKTIVVYVSKELEVDTRRLMEKGIFADSGGYQKCSLHRAGVLQ